MEVSGEGEVNSEVGVEERVSKGGGRAEDRGGGKGEVRGEVVFPKN